MVLRYALRSLAKSKGFVVVAVLALGIGLGLSTTMFAVLDAVVHPYVAYREPDQLFTVHWWFGRRNPMSPSELYRFLRDNTHSFEGIVPIGQGMTTLETAGDLREIWTRSVSARWFTLAGVKPRLGRAFTESDESGVAIASDELWRRQFGRRNSLESATIRLNGRTFAVVGVLPRGALNGQVALPLPAAVDHGGGAGEPFVRPMVRLRRGVTREQADVELKALARLLTERFQAEQAPFAFELDPLVGRREELRDIHKAMVGSALAVLLIACVNLAHLMLARGLGKRRELALRMALGASRAVVVRQMFTECLIITVAGAALGAVVTTWGADILEHGIPPEVAWIGFVQPQLSWRVFALAALAAALAAVLFGLMPAVRVALGVSLDEPLKDDSGTTTGRARHRYNALVITEVGLALVLMMGGALLLRTVHQLQREQPGFDARTLFRAYVGTRRGADTTGAAARARREELLTAVAGVPGVRDVGFETNRRARGGAVSAELSEDSSRTITMQMYSIVTPPYLRVLGLPILKGRDFEPGDAAGDGVAIIDPIAAARLYPNQDPIGKMLKLGSPGSDAPWVPIVGVVRSPYVLEAAGRDAPSPALFVAQRSDRNFGWLLIRTATRDARTAAQLHARLREMPDLALMFLEPYDRAREAELASRGFLAKVFVGMGAVALGLAALGLYGVLAYAVGRRTREFAVRIALGAEPAALLRMVLHDGLVMLLAGIGAGAFAALAASRLLDAVLIAVLPSDVTSLVLCEVVLLVVGLASALGPARRAMRADPMAILRAV